MGLYSDRWGAVGLTAPSFQKLGWGARFTDVEFDGFLDLLVSNGHVYPEVDSAGIGESYRQNRKKWAAILRRPWLPESRVGPEPG